jgi:DNA-binding CsgD family transcriptional regulator
VAIAAGLDEAAEVAALNRAAFAYRTLGLVVDAERLGRRAWDVARRVILPAAMAEAGHSLARSLRELGRFAEARSVAAETVAIEARLQNPSRRWGNALSVLHVVDMCVADPKDGLGRLRDDARREADPHYRLAVHQITAVWLARLDAPSDDILDELASADAASALARCPRCARELEIEGAGLLARAGSIDAAVRRLGQDPREPGDDYIHRHLRWLRSRAEIAAASGDHDGAVHQFADLVSVAEAAGLVEEVIWGSIDLGRVSAPRDRAGAVAALRRAADLAGRAGGTTHHRVATRALRKLGVRTWRRTPRTDGGVADPNRVLIDLSVREREVAALVAAGHSNREIGEALDIAPKTVERHVTNALTKLAVRNRTELAALMTGLAVRDSPDD